MDVKLFTTDGHRYKSDNLSQMEQEKRSKVRDGYNAKNLHQQASELHVLAPLFPEREDFGL